MTYSDAPMHSSPTSPTSRRRPRRTSSASSNGQPTPLNTASRRSSQYSPVSRRSSRAFTDGNSLTSPGADGDLGGNLADELANAFEEDEGIEEGASETALSPVDGTQRDPREEYRDVKVDPARVRDSGIDVASSTSAATTPVKEAPPTNIRQATSSHARKHSRKQSQRAVDSPVSQRVDPADDLPASLRARLAEVETLARQGTSYSADDVPEEADEEDGSGGAQDTSASQVSRFLTSLRDLGGQQSGIESGATRLITAHTALSMHLAHQTRALHSLSFGLVLPAPLAALPPQPYSASSNPQIAPERSISPMPDEDPLLQISALLSSLPQPSVPALDSMNRLSTLTADTIATLSNLSDSLHMSRQTTATAARRLRGARELVAEIRRDESAWDEGVRWIEEGRWGARLEGRECAGICRDVVGGFEEVCGDWRRRLVEGAGAA